MGDVSVCYFSPFSYPFPVFRREGYDCDAPRLYNDRFDSGNSLLQADSDLQQPLRATVPLHNTTSSADGLMGLGDEKSFSRVDRISEVTILTR